MQILQSQTARDAAGALSDLLDRGETQRPSQRFFESDHSQIWQHIVEGEWTALGVAEKHGGAGLSLLDLALIADVWGRHLIPLPFIPSMLIRRWLQEGDSSGSSMLTYGLPLPSVRTDEEQHVISPFLGLAGTRYATKLPPLESMGLHEVESRAKAPVLDAAANERGKPRADFAPSLPLGRAPFATAGISEDHKLDIAILAASELIGSCEKLLEWTIEYARDRQQFGHSIAEYQAVQHRLANMHRDIEISRTAVIWATNESERARGAIRIVWDRMRTITENSFQVHGGFGFTWDSGVHYYSRHVWATGRLLSACGVNLWPN